MADPQFTKNDAENRYEISLDGERIGFIDYVRDGDVIDMTHTEVDPEHQGQGYAGQLADFALQDVQTTGLTVRPTCPFIADHIEANAEYGSIIAAH